MKTIPVQNSDRVIWCDDEDFERLSKYKWWFTNKTVVITKFPRNKSVSIARIVMCRKVMFDHIDRNPFNNCKSNLRECSIAQNAWNKSKLARTTSKYKGVHWAKANKKWKAKIVFLGKRIHLGYFDIEEDAARAYDAAACKLFLEFANLNFPPVKGENATQSLPVQQT